MNFKNIKDLIEIVFKNDHIDPMGFKVVLVYYYKTFLFVIIPITLLTIN
jgi:hypothetical protein